MPVEKSDIVSHVFRIKSELANYDPDNLKSSKGSEMVVFSSQLVISWMFNSIISE